MEKIIAMIKVRWRMMEKIKAMINQMIV